ncbi:ubiquitin-associated domain-containing protein 2-like isoform X1 [Antedon mediterranea]|uniref:ubiquitin-associated domain-containing protein 2-like isoform X1 n=1 Tax=Antedon mediterranea TaxID=105859 RepID=UPI003AF52C06
MPRPIQLNIQGFYKTPVSKVLMPIIAIPSLILNFTPTLRPFFLYSLEDLTNPYKVWRVLSCKLVFHHTTDLVCGLILIYYFRIFERRAGSRKFCSYIQSMFILCTLLEIFCLVVMQHGFEKLTWKPGFHSVLMSFFVKFYMDVPRTNAASICGIPFSSKSITYFMGLQIVFLEPMNAIFSVCGILMGILYRLNFINLQNWFNIPESVADFVSRTIGAIVRTKPPQRLLQPMGATREIQRQQRMELLEQEMLLTQAQGFLNRQHSIRRRHNARQDQIQTGIHMNRDNGAPQQPPAEDKIVQLIEMGFSRSDVLQALSVVNNDVTMATNLLLQE